jgi:hypothetical protein
MRATAISLVMAGAMVTTCATPPASTPLAAPGSPATPAVTMATASTTPGTSTPPAGASLAQAYVDFWKSTPLILHAVLTETTNPVPGVPEERFTTTWDVSGTDVAFVQAHQQGDQVTESARINLGGTTFGREAGGGWTSSPRTMVTPLTGRTILMLSGTDNPAKLEDLGVETVDGRALHHLRVTAPVSWQIGNDITSFGSFDAWVTDDGTPVLARAVNPPEGDWPGSQLEIRISNVGGPVVIRAPDGVPAVTPSPFVTPAPPVAAHPDPAGWIRYVSPGFGYSVALPPVLPYGGHVDDGGRYDHYWGSLTSSGPYALLYVSCTAASESADGGTVPPIAADLTVDGVPFATNRSPQDVGADLYQASGLKGDTLCGLMAETDDSDAAWGVFLDIATSFRFPSPAFVEPSPPPPG